MKRRTFVRTTMAGGLGGALGGAMPAAGGGTGTTSVAAQTPAPTAPASTGAEDRAYWVSLAGRLAEPVLANLAAGTLKTAMPVEEAAGANRRPVTHLEALGRLLAGLAPWLELPADDTPEGRARTRFAHLARTAIGQAVDPASPDALNFTEMRQPLVDAAFLAQAVVRAPQALGTALPAATRTRLVAALESTRRIAPGFSNWLLFSAMVEVGLRQLGAWWDPMRVDYALRQHEQWYKGDGHYGDGPEFHWDYYNSFVIQPMLLETLDAVGGEMPAWKAMVAPVQKRAARYAAVLERLISPEGTFPPIGRSLAYRAGAFHLLAQMAWRRALPPELPPAQVRAALTAVQRRAMEAPGTFDGQGWLRIGFAGHQPGIGESYISTGSLYLCAFALLPLGLPMGDPFWRDPAQPWTARRAWTGQPMGLDKAL